MGNTAYLVMENGKTFKGEYFGAEGEVISEVVFTTGMTGYLETLTDRSFYGQIVVQTFPLIGNYGVIPADFESDEIGLSAYIVKDWCQVPSNFRSEGALDTFLKERGLVAIKGIDTRTLTKLIREKGVMNGMITADPSKADLETIRAHKIKDAVRNSTTKKIYTLGDAAAPIKIALMDYGLKKSIPEMLVKRGAYVTVYPCDTPPEEVLASDPKGLMLSNGPGDPTENPVLEQNLRELLKTGIPTFGICLGHQILALANGLSTEKLKYGHRGENQPVKNLKTGKIYISSQNHGYAVKSGSMNPDKAETFFENVNDGTNEGVWYKSIPAFSVQFHPEACGGPQETEFLFDNFFDMIRSHKT